MPSAIFLSGEVLQNIVSLWATNPLIPLADYIGYPRNDSRRLSRSLFGLRSIGILQDAEAEKEKSSLVETREDWAGPQSRLVYRQWYRRSGR